MTDKAVSQLTALTGANTATGDLLYIVDISEAAAADRSKKITAQELQNYVKAFPATIGVGGATPAASGAGITFPATASASSDANTLDDYEEGVFNPTIIGSSSNGTASYSIQNGRYTIVGRLVFVEIYLSWSSGTGTGNLQIGNLPATPSASATFASAAIGWFSNVSLTASNVGSGYFGSGSPVIEIAQNVVGGGASSAVPYDAAGQIQISGCYTI